jgi:hypothetical protein
MDLMDIQDITSIDISELGVRPLSWTDDDNDIDFNDTNVYFGKEKLNELQIINNGKTDEEDISMVDEDDLNYEIDPETGKSNIGFFVTLDI